MSQPESLKALVDRKGLLWVPLNKEYINMCQGNAIYIKMEQSINRKKAIRFLQTLLILNNPQEILSFEYSISSKQPTARDRSPILGTCHMSFSHTIMHRDFELQGNPSLKNRSARFSS